MAAIFYLFDVGVGQSAALVLPNGQWCIFDVGKSSEFSVVNWIADSNKSYLMLSALLNRQAIPTFKFLKATISHYHGDHLNDCKSLFQYTPEYLFTVQGDSEYTNDVIKSNSVDSLSNVLYLMQQRKGLYRDIITQPDYGPAFITEMYLPVSISRKIGGEHNSKVNNSSIITRIDVFGNSILLCGDMEKDAWQSIISDNGIYGKVWRPFLRNIDILVAPHHGHKSGYSIDLLNLAKPSVVLVSVQSKDPHVDSRYSQDPVRGLKIGNDSYSYISTRQKGHIKVTIEPSKTILGKGERSWSFGENALN